MDRNPYLHANKFRFDHLKVAMSFTQNAAKNRQKFDKLSEYILNPEQVDDTIKYPFRVCDVPKVLAEANGQLTKLLTHGYNFLDSIETDGEYTNLVRLEWHRVMLWRSKAVEGHEDHWEFINKLFEETLLAQAHFLAKSLVQIKSISGTCIFWLSGLTEKNLLRLAKKVLSTLKKQIDAQNENHLDQKFIEHLAKIATHLLRSAVDDEDKDRKPKTDYLNDKGCSNHVHRIPNQLKDLYNEFIKNLIEPEAKKRLKGLGLPEWPLKLLGDLIAFAPEKELYQLWDLACLSLGCELIITRCTPMLLVAKWLSSMEENSLNQEQADLVTKFCLIYLDDSHIVDPFYAIQVLQVLILRHPKRINDVLGYTIVVSTMRAKERQSIFGCPQFVHRFSRRNLTFIFIAFYAAEKCQQLHRLIDKARNELTLKPHITEWSDNMIGPDVNSLGFLDETIFPLESSPQLEPWHNYYISLIALSKLPMPIYEPLAMSIITSHIPANLLFHYKHTMQAEEPLKHRDFYRTAKIFIEMFEEELPKHDFYERESLHFYRDVNKVEFLDKPFKQIDEFEKKLKERNEENFKYWETQKDLWKATINKSQLLQDDDEE